MKKKREIKMIEDEYSGKPYAILIAVMFGVIIMAFVFIGFIVMIVNLIFN